MPAVSAAAVDHLTAAGAIVIGKTNLDQFATGLVGTRSPYGTPRNPFDSAVVPGGSSSGSGVAVATGIVVFALTARDAALVLAWMAHPDEADIYSRPIGARRQRAVAAPDDIVLGIPDD